MLFFMFLLHTCAFVDNTVLFEQKIFMLKKMSRCENIWCTMVLHGHFFKIPKSTRGWGGVACLIHHSFGTDADFVVSSIGTGTSNREKMSFDETEM